MKHSRFIILILTLIFGMGALFQPAYAVDCFQSGTPDHCMPSSHEGHTSAAGHAACVCTPVDNWSNSSGCNRTVVYPRLEMAVVRLDSDDTPNIFSGVSAKVRIPRDEFVPIRHLNIRTDTPPPRHLPIYIWTLTLLV